MRRLLSSIVPVLLAAAVASAGALEDKKTEAETGAAEQSRGLLDCVGAVELSCGDAVAGTNVGAANYVGSYGCASALPYDQSGEVVYTFTLDAQWNATITLAGMTCDLDLFLLGSCDEGDCLAYSAGVSDEVIAACLPPGTYYVVVDGYGSSTPNECAFDISLACFACPMPPENDQCWGAIDLCATGGEKDGSFDIPFDLTLANNDYDPGSGGCTGYAATGRDVVYKVCLEDGGLIDVCEIPDAYFDASLYLVTDCGDVVASCVAGDDSGNPECLVWTNSTGGAVTYYLIVDAYGGGGGPGVLSGVTVGCCAATGTEEGSWGELKTLFR